MKYKVGDEVLVTGIVSPVPVVAVVDDGERGVYYMVRLGKHIHPYVYSESQVEKAVGRREFIIALVKEQARTERELKTLSQDGFEEEIKLVRKIYGGH